MLAEPIATRLSRPGTNNYRAYSSKSFTFLGRDPSGLLGPGKSYEEDCLMKLGTQLSVAATAAVALFAAIPASAAPFTFNFSGTGFYGGTLNGMGTITTDGSSFVNSLNGYTAQHVTGITGTFNGSNITGLSTVFGADNLYYLSGPFFVDGQGLSFTTAAGGSANLFITNDTSYRVNAGGLLTGLVTASSMPAAGAAPEPATWAMMILGFGVVGLGLRRRQKVTTRVSYAG